MSIMVIAGYYFCTLFNHFCKIYIMYYLAVIFQGGTMTDKELKRAGKKELLELLYAMSKELDRVRE